MICELCGKKPVFSIKVAHQRMYVSGRSNRKIKPNLHSATIFDNGIKKRVTACARCIKTNKRNNLIRQ